MATKAFVSNLPMALSLIETANMKALSSAALVGRNKIVENLSGTRTGRKYKVPGTQTYYTASAPGEYPAVATGLLRESIQWRVSRDDAKVGALTKVEYADALEGRPGEPPGIRPFLKKSLDEAKAEMKAKLAERWF
jgi:hypothetical protein